MNNSKNRKTDIQATLKSQDTEEWLDIVFTRPIGYQWTLFFNRFNVHPNVVTILSIILGAWAGLMFSYSDFLHNLSGVLLLMWANFYDSCDGQLARMTGKKTRLGRILDGFAGDVWFLCIYLAIAFRLFHRHIPLTTVEWGWWVVALGLICGFLCHARQCGLADYYRNIHLFFLKGQAGSELDNSRQQWELFKKASWKKEPVWKAFLFGYYRYTKGQEAQTPQFQKLLAKIKGAYGSDIPQEFRTEFRRGSLPLMKYANILTFNTRAIALYISCLIDEPWLYLLFELVPMTALYFYMRHRHENLCKQMAVRIP